MCDIDNIIFIIWIIWIILLFTISVKLFKLMINSQCERQFKGGIAASMSVIDQNLNNIVFPSGYPNPGTDDYNNLLYGLINAIQSGIIHNNRVNSTHIEQLKTNISNLIHNNNDANVSYLYTKGGRQTTHELIGRYNNNSNNSVNITIDEFENSFDRCVNTLCTADPNDTDLNGGAQQIYYAAENISQLFINYHYANANDINDRKYLNIKRLIIKIYNNYY